MIIITTWIKNRFLKHHYMQEPACFYPTWATISKTDQCRDIKDQLSQLKFGQTQRTTLTPFWFTEWGFIFFFLYIYIFFKFYLIFKLYIIVLVLPNIKMNPPQVYMGSPSWTLLPPPSPYHPSGSSQCTSPKHTVTQPLKRIHLIQF